jgi:peptide/nickel transport system permease protein
VAIAPETDPGMTTGGQVELPRWRDALRRLVRRPGTVTAAAVLLVFVLGALGAPRIARFPPNEQPDAVGQRHLSPSATHWFGTDQYSRDVFSRVVHGTRVSLEVGLLAVAIAALVGTAWGAVAGYVGGWADLALMRLVDALFAVPRVLLLVMVAALWYPLPLSALILVLGLTGWFGVSRLVRGEIRSVQQREFVQAARALGAGRVRVLVRHIIPHVVAPVLVTATIGVANAIVMESGLSFLGLGIAPPDPSWGSIIGDGYPFIASAWWVSAFPGIALITTVLAVNTLADGLRDALNPRQLHAP